MVSSEPGSWRWTYARPLEIGIELSLPASHPLGCAGKFELLPLKVGIRVEQTGELALQSKRPNDSEIGSETRGETSSFYCAGGVIGDTRARGELTQGNPSAHSRKPQPATELASNLQDGSRQTALLR